MEKITYTSLNSLGEDFHQAFEAAADFLKKQLGKTYPMFIHGKPVQAKEGTFEDINPSNTRAVLGRFQKGNALDARKAILSAKKAFPSWRDIHWQQRIAILRKAANLIAQQQFELAALLSMEVGKNRFEAIAEVLETIDLILYYCQQMEEHHGYVIPLQNTAQEQSHSILRPYGVWAVISPFNFPMALSVGMAAGALIAGNTVVYKPASDTPLSGFKIAEIFRDAGLPNGIFNFITGSGNQLSDELIKNPDVDGFIFTGSRAVGMNLLRRFNQHFPRPCITEMGGKNPAIIMPSANLEDATEGVYRSAFGMGGQKCSACSRLYLHRDIYKSFLDLLTEKTKKCKVGNPLTRDTFLGPLINAHAVQTYQRAVRLGKKEGRIICGGNLLKEEVYAHGYFVEPTMVDQLPKNSAMFQDEYFVPILAVAKINSLEEAITLANQSEYGLTAGIFTNHKKEQEVFFNQIESGVTYCNRRGGATTGAWPGLQSFGGWKGSGSSGKGALGPYYVAQFMREQSQTRIKSSK